MFCVFKNIQVMPRSRKKYYQETEEIRNESRKNI